MIKRLSTAAIGFVLAVQMMPAEARPYYGYDGRNYGQLQTAPNYGRPSRAPHSVGAQRARDAAGGSRRGLTPAALALLERIESKFGPVNVISGYRPGARIAGSGRISRHASGNAIDFEAGGRKGAIVKWLIANHRSGGTMTYAHMGHIHVDIGEHFVSLGSGSGRSRQVASSRNRDAARYAAAGYSRRYSGERRSRDGYASTHHGQRYASGYATIYQ